MKPIKMGVMIITAVLLLSAVTPIITLAQSSSVNNSTAIATTDTRLWDVNAPLSAAQKAQINASGLILTQAQIAEIKATAAKKLAVDKQEASNSVTAHAKALMAAGKVPTISGPGTIKIGASADNLQTLSNVWYYGANDYAFSGPPANGGSGMGSCVQTYDSTNKLIRQYNGLTGLGWGTNDAWAWQGTTFVWTGPTGNYNANYFWYMYGATYNDYAVADGVSSAYTEIDIVLKDITTGTGPQTNIAYQATANLPVSCIVTPNTKSQSMAVHLVNGHQYSAYVLLDGQVSVWGWASASSDFQTMNNGFLQFSTLTIQ
jgi:hypothetical protein